MEQTSVNIKYQVVIPKAIRNKVKIKPGQKLNINVSGEQIILSRAPTKTKWNWPQDHIKKLGGIWKPEEIDKYLEEERNSWD